MKPERQPDPAHLYAILLRRVADRLDLRSACPARACLRNRHCTIAPESGPACRLAARPEARARFDAVLATIEAIRNFTLWPEPSRSDELRAAEALAIDILAGALPLMPDFAAKFEDWLRRYDKWPTQPADGRFWLKLAREDIARHREGNHPCRLAPKLPKIPG